MAVQSGLVAEPRIEQTLLRLGQVLMPSLTVSVVVQPLAAAKLRHLLAPFVGQDVALALQKFDGLLAREVEAVDAFRREPAPFRSTKAAVKLHTLLDLRGNIPTFIHISDGKMHEVNVLDQLLPEAGAFYIMDRGFLDFERLFRFHEAGSFFVTRAKSNFKAQRRYSHPVDRSTGLVCDQTVLLTGFYSRKGFEAPLRRIRFKDPETGKTLVFITNNFVLPALTITQLYRCRWQVELFFKWIKQHLRIKAFFGTSENAVKTQIWIAISVYVIVAIVKKRMKIPASLYEILQILSLTVFERIPLDQLLAGSVEDEIAADLRNQLNLFE